MKKAIIILIVTIPLMSFDIKPFIFIRNDVKIETLLVLPPVSSVSVISAGSKQQIDSVLSRQLFYHTSTMLKKCFPDTVKTRYFPFDSVVQLKLLNWVSAVNKEINNEKRARKYQLPDSILNLFDTSKMNFVFCTYNTGFKRTRNNLMNTHQTSEIADVLIGFNYRPLESTALMSCFILDLRKKSILYFARDLWENKDPMDFNVIRLQLTRIITHYFI